MMCDGLVPSIDREFPYQGQIWLNRVYRQWSTEKVISQVDIIHYNVTYGY